jgi:hypothetical protein
MYDFHPAFIKKSSRTSSNPIYFNFLSFSLKPNTSKVIFSQVSKNLNGFHLLSQRLTRGMRFFLIFSNFRNSRVLILILNFLAYLAFSWLGCELGSCYRVVVTTFLHYFQLNCAHSDLGVFALNPKPLKFLDFSMQLMYGLKPKSFYDDLGTKPTQPLARI